MNDSKLRVPEEEEFAMSETPLGVTAESTARQNQPATDADLTRDAVRYQNRGCHAAAGTPDNFLKRRARQDVHIAPDQ